MPTACCVFGCSRSQPKNGDASFHRFPKDQYRLRKWILLLRIGGKLKYSAARVCSNHFSEKQYKEPMILKSDALPDINLPGGKPKPSNEVIVDEIDVSSVDASHTLDDKSIESHDLDHDPLGDSYLDAIHDPEADKFQSYRTYSNHYSNNHVLNDSIDAYGVVEVEVIGSIDVVGDMEVETVIGSIDVEGEMEVETVGPLCAESEPQDNYTQPQHDGSFPHGGFSLKLDGDLSTDDIKYLTGHTLKQFQFIYNFVIKDQPEYSWPNKTVSLKNQLLLTLMKFRHNFDYMLLAILFKIHYITASAIFRFWTDLMYDKFDRVDFWKLRVDEEGLYTIILDCTEIPIQKPKSPAEQQATWSSYKNTNTFKGLIGIDEAGMIMFVSTLYGGSVTDDLIVQKSGVVDKLKDGDYILADRGFGMTDTLAEKGIIMNKPPKKRGSQMSASDVANTRAVASRRVNVERVIGLAKKNRILSQRVPHALFEIFPKIFRLIFLLTNIQPSICQKISRTCRCP